MGIEYDVQAVREMFPALAREVQGRPAVFLDNPGGTQVPRPVVEAIADYLYNHNANHGGEFATSRESDAIVAAARAAMADFLVAPSPESIVFGPNMTSLTLNISRSIGRTLSPGDEVAVTRMDHDANVTPWLLMAEDAGATVRWVDVNTTDCTLDFSSFEEAINERTRVVAVGYASNASGTVNDVAAVVELAHRFGAWVYVDAVAYAPHGPIDVTALDCDFLACSPYKFYGPHMGVLYGRPEIMDSLTAYKVRPAPLAAPGKFETGTGNFEHMAGGLAAINYLAGLGEKYGRDYRSGHPGLSGRALDLKTAYDVIQAHERRLSEVLIDRLTAFDGLTIHGLTDTRDMSGRVPTFSFTWGDRHPADIARHLGEEGVFTWDGHYYALCLVEALGLVDKGGMLRVGMAHYNTAEEIDRLAGALAKLA